MFSQRGQAGLWPPQPHRWDGTWGRPASQLSSWPGPTSSQGRPPPLSSQMEGRKNVVSARATDGQARVPGVCKSPDTGLQPHPIGPCQHRIGQPLACAPTTSPKAKGSHSSGYRAFFLPSAAPASASCPHLFTEHFPAGAATPRGLPDKSASRGTLLTA